jgi:hypothetical protein
MRRWHDGFEISVATVWLGPELVGMLSIIQNSVTMYVALLTTARSHPVKIVRAGM